MTSTPLWTPDSSMISNSNMRLFADECESRTGRLFSDYEQLHSWSVDSMDEFWDFLWDFAGVRGKKGSVILRDSEQMPGARFFPEGSLSFAENLLTGEGDDAAIIYRDETSSSRLSWNELRSLVSRLQQAFRDLGLKRGDRIAAMLPNRPETIACMLAANSLGAVWSSCSPDFGETGVLDRFSQITPTLFIACDGYTYNGTRFDITERVSSIASSLSVRPIIIPDGQSKNEIPNRIFLGDLLSNYESAPLEFEQLPFNHPLYILFSSGTTGKPKCIVHGQGGTLLKHLSEHLLHSGTKQGDRVFYFTTCGWMMWNWLVSALAVRATVMLYDGNPLLGNSPTILFDYASDERINLFGVSAKYIDAVRTSGLSPIQTHDLSSLKTIASTGSPLTPQNFEFVYEHIKSDVHLASVSGGTDIVGCFVSSIPWHPVFVGEIQGKALGMATDVWDDEGNSVTGEKGELVCTRPFPSLPLGFFGDDADNTKYREAYFSHYPNIWRHGDFAEWTSNGGMIIHGRSDATLNPGGVRIGTAEIYAHVERMDEVEESLCVGQRWSSDTRIVLFVRLRSGVELTDDLRTRIRDVVRVGASPRHVPAKIVSVSDIPRTRSGKITEIAVSDIIHGREVKNKEALSNPEALDLFRDLPDLSV